MFIYIHYRCLISVVVWFSVAKIVFCLLSVVNYCVIGVSVCLIYNKNEFIDKKKGSMQRYSPFLFYSAIKRYFSFFYDANIRIA